MELFTGLLLAPLDSIQYDKLYITSLLDIYHRDNTICHSGKTHNRTYLQKKSLLQSAFCYNGYRCSTSYFFHGSLMSRVSKTPVSESWSWSRSQSRSWSRARLGFGLCLGQHEDIH
jgi:hypothetical protein